MHLPTLDVLMFLSKRGILLNNLHNGYEIELQYTLREKKKYLHHWVIFTGKKSIHPENIYTAAEGALFIQFIHTKKSLTKNKKQNRKNWKKR